MHDQMERIAERVHNAWWLEKLRQIAQDGATAHPHCVPYCELPEHVKEYDRVTARTVIEALKDEGYELPGL